MDAKIASIMGAATTERDPAAAPNTNDHKIRLVAWTRVGTLSRARR
jgi:hypothetical protein